MKKPDVKVFLKKGVAFEDGSFEEVDSVILCTGKVIVISVSY